MEELEGKVRDARARIAFYASTPGYRAAFHHLGLDDLATAAARFSRAREWERLPALIDDEVLDAFVTIGLHDSIGDRLLERYAAVVTDVEFSIAVHDDTDRATLTGLATTLRTHDDAAARAAIRG